MINLVSRRVGLAAFIAFAVSAAAPAVDAGDRHHDGDDNRYVVTNLVSDLPGAAHPASNLKNAWGVAFTPGASPFWIADNATGLSTLYDGDGAIVPLGSPSGGVTIPCPPPATVGQGSSCPPSPPPNNAAPTGMVWNPTTSMSTGFLVPLTGKVASFIWATEDGTISAWTLNLA